MIRKMINSIQELLNERYWKAIQNNECELEERQPNDEENMKVKITKLPSNVLKVTIPSGVHIAIMKDQSKKSCDYLILASKKTDIDVYFVEIKKSLNPNQNGVPLKACEQIRHTIPVWDYLVSMMKIHSDEETRRNKIEIKKHFVVIASSRGRRDKQKTRPQSIYRCEYKNENFKIIHSLDTIPFNHLRCQQRS